LFTPRMQATLAEQGFGHKSVLRFRTPGLEGLRGSCG
jgi:phenol hydroxylase P4 protein